MFEIYSSTDISRYWGHSYIRLPTDGSDKVCQSFAEKDSRIKIIYNKHNLHIGLSRNRGLDIAQGEYIAFSDDDDTRELNICMRSFIIRQNKKMQIWLLD